MEQPRIINCMTVRTVANGIEVALSQNMRPGYLDDKDIFVFESTAGFIEWCAAQKWVFAGKEAA